MNFFKELESEILSTGKLNEDLIKSRITNEIDSAKSKGIRFEEIVCDFFEYVGFKVIRTKQTRDFGIDAIVEIDLEPLGGLKLGLQTKWKTIGSEDVDALLSALRLAEIRVGILACKESRRLDKYSLSSKIRALLITTNRKETIKINGHLEPVYILNFKDILDIFTGHAESILKAIYKQID